MRLTSLSDLLGSALGSRDGSNLHKQAVKYLPLRLGDVNFSQLCHEPT